MSRTRPLPTLLLLLAASLAGHAALAAVEEDTADRLAVMAAAYWEEYLALYPTQASSIGDHRYDDRLEIAIGADHRARAREMHSRYLAAAHAFDPSGLDPAGRETLALFTAEQERGLVRLGLPGHLMPFNQMNAMPLAFAGRAAARASIPSRR